MSCTGSKTAISISSRSRFSQSSGSVASQKLRATARKASLLAEAAKLDKFNILQQEELRLQQLRRGLEIETELAKAEAEERIFSEEQEFCF